MSNQTQLFNVAPITDMLADETQALGGLGSAHEGLVGFCRLRHLWGAFGKAVSRQVQTISIKTTGCEVVHPRHSARLYVKGRAAVSCAMLQNHNLV